MEAKATESIAVRLEVLDGSGAVVQANEFRKDKVVLGRILSADMRIDDTNVSRIHALIEVRDGNLLITDLASTHGTFLNGQKVVEAKLKFGDVLRLGKIEVRLVKATGNVTQLGQQPSVFADSDPTQLEIDDANRRRTNSDRRKRNAFPDETRMDQRRQGDRRFDSEPTGNVPKPSGTTKPMSTEGLADQTERRVGERRRQDRRIFDITSLERRINDRRNRKSDDDVLPEELEKAFAAPDHARELEVTILWGDYILDVSNYIESGVISVGESPENQYIIPSVGIPEQFPLISIEEDGTAYLAFTDEMSGTVRAREKMYTLSELKQEKFIKKFADYYVVALKQDDFAKISVGTINFFVLYVKPAPRIKPAPFFDRDPLLIRTAIGTVLVMAFFFLSLLFVPEEPKPVTIEMIPERYAKIVIKQKPKIPAAGIVVKGMDNKEGGSVMGEGGAPKGPEGEVGKPELPKKTEKAQSIAPKSTPKEAAPAPKTASKVPPPTPRKVVDQNKAKSVGLLKAFSMSGVQKDLKNLVDAGSGAPGQGGFDDFGKAVSGLRGKGIEESGGAGGKGLKGVDVGGGGKTIGIDGPSTKGLGRGYGGDGIGEGVSGPGRLGMKGEHAVSIVSENVQVLSGLPKDVIAAVVNRHRSEIRACYDAALTRNPNIRGKLVVAFNIQPNGIVSFAGVKDGIGDSQLDNCVVSRIRSWVFPKPEAPVVTEVAAYPFMLSPAN